MDLGFAPTSLFRRRHPRMPLPGRAQRTAHVKQMSETALPHNGEAQLAEVRKPDGSSVLVFNGRTNKKGSPRGIAWSYDDGQTFTVMKFVADISAGVSCMASMISLDEHPVLRSSTADANAARNTSLLFSHPSRTNRSAGVLLRSNDAAVSNT